MAASKHDPHNLREIAKTVVLGYRITRRQEKGKATGRLERQVDRIREQAQAREDARAKGRKK
ncbi:MULTISPECIES: hypothetical protein [unclassified Streptomyces]|uniref:hypothetical protein n=1 Tax=unclassified Streptomyces TaxID=2593676 RepID=UPI00093F95C6|nr:hypothetical protein [Streptomyces sp. CB01883]OKJ87281.1 hypothetical protein AMK32_08570 [Streptomyces sp. CB01883]